jgi:hypothetical protein
VVDAIRVHFGSRAAAAIRIDESYDGQPVLGVTRSGACLFYDQDGQACEIHRDLGEPFLPSACRHFPRVVLSDARGTFITLSHFCPTAAGLLFTTPGPSVVAAAALSVVEAPATLTLGGTVEGLDARLALPPLLREGMLTDLDGYDAWERASLSLIVEGAADAGTALERITAATRVVSRWSPPDGPLRECVSRAFAETVAPAAVAGPERSEAQLAALALASVPKDLPVPDIVAQRDVPWLDPADAWRRFDSVIRRYLAARLFGNWWGYLGLDLGGIVTAIRVHQALLRRQLARRLATCDPAGALLEAIRDTDLVMLHLSDPGSLARLLQDLR